MTKIVRGVCSGSALIKAAGGGPVVWIAHVGSSAFKPEGRGIILAPAPAPSSVLPPQNCPVCVHQERGGPLPYFGALVPPLTCGMDCTCGVAGGPGVQRLGSACSLHEECTATTEHPQPPGRHTSLADSYPWPPPLLCSSRPVVVLKRTNPLTHACGVFDAIAALFCLTSQSHKRFDQLTLHATEQHAPATTHSCCHIERYTLCNACHA